MANKPQGVKAPKSEKSRRASYIDETLKKLLTKHWEFQNKYLLEKRYINPNNYVFISERNVGPSGIVKAANISSLYTWLKRFTRKNGLSQVGPHAFRHMGATYALMEGVPLTVVQDLLGHSDITTTSIYLHSIASKKKEVVKVLGKYTDNI